ncbi:hypothetical protein DRO69_01385 [Candidatus Bathyarchaeota archaeon]|nr:MAG: hypothetical protein DRO69_01385 [Candidatus Bathyarchaeota archaeon]
MEREKLIVASALLIALILIAAYLIPMPTYTIISVSKIEVQPQGYENAQTGEWEGSYWVITAVTDMTDEIGAVKLENSTEGTVDGKKLVTTSEITIKIDPHRPYWEIPVTWEPVQVYPKTYRSWVNKLGLGYLHGRDEDVYVPAKTLTVYRFTRDYWEAHTPFTIYVYKNDKLIGSKYIDTIGGTETVTIENPDDPKEKVIITNLGKIGAAYQLTLKNLIFIESLTYAYDEDALSLLRYDQTSQSFSQYWFGPAKTVTEYGSAYNRWKDIGSPIGFWAYDTAAGTMLQGRVEAPGWQADDDFWNYKQKPKEASFNTIIDYVEDFYVRKNIDVWGQGAKIVGGKLRVYLPYGAMSSLITIKISSELADTIVWRPPTANLKIVDYTQIGDVGDRVSFMVKVRQESTVRSTGRISIEITPPNAPAAVVPEYVSPTLNPGEEATFYFDFINLGTDQKISGQVNIICTELTTGTVTDQASISYTLLPREEEAVTLEVYTIDKETGEKVSGIPVTIKWDTQSDLKYTDEGVAVWDMKGYTGTVFISSAETAAYKSESTSTTLHRGINTVTLYLEKSKAPPPSIPEWAIYIIIASIIAVAIVASVYLISRRR